MKFIIFKIDDIEKACNQNQLLELYKIARMIREMRENDGRIPNPNYLIVNTDEPYADQVRVLIEEYEGEKITFD